MVTAMVKTQYYTPHEVSMHSAPDDCWVSFLGGVNNLTQFIKANEGPLVQPLIRAAGQDISHWFDADTGDIRTHIDPNTNIERPHCPEGRFLHIAPNEPVSNWDTGVGTPWWRDKTSQVGLLSLSTRVIRIKNVLTSQEDKLEVPSEETIRQIRDRYLNYNWHAASYTWKVMKPVDGEYLFTVLDLDKTLDQNGVSDEQESFEALGIPDDYYIPVIHLYYKDDLTVA
mmetsp:Transcript_3122/g.5306  ORF Transcript_3122/g.5306 Transcript_3122/m.5306 type:complete len:227 (+) Transcript_3122:176-856(+)|eukprot:CAMPEP_0198205428 /NCGR_PEP_ID=MMETSP1445-20131203/8964_1 /TAXON_ID=36898 /ORGANISM="Pyramimonas sp., Strain CCMP2087" /LENGTH=226 /DNA_ID=CAMNT_0043877737 /DNA_START=176 /DNA_END=856 /DNA_ORIENTATION=-